MAKTKLAAFHLTLALLVALASTFTLASSQLVFAGGTPVTGSVTDQLITQEGAWAGASVGDYVGSTLSSGGLNTYYSYFIEVPSGLSQLTVDIFDAEVGSNGFNNDQLNERDRARDGYDTCAQYSVFWPDGTRVGGIAVGPSTGCYLSRPIGNCPACDNTWQTLRTEASPQSGHWELRVDMSSAVTRETMSTPSAYVPTTAPRLRGHGAERLRCLLPHRGNQRQRQIRRLYDAPLRHFGLLRRCE